MYDGDPHSVTASATGADGDTFAYFYRTTSDGAWSAEKPTFTDAGSNTVYVKATNPNYGELYQEAAVEITARKILVQAGSASFPYDGSAKSVTEYGVKAAEGDYYALVEGQTLTAVLANNTHINAGKYTVGFNQAGTKVMAGTTEITGNYDIHYATGELEITLCQTGTLDVTGFTGVYDAEPHSVTASATGAEGDTFAYFYRTTSDGAWSSEKPTFTDAGSYTVYVKATNSNYGELYQEATVEIAARKILVQAGSASFPYDGSAKSVTEYGVKTGDEGYYALVDGQTLTAVLSNNTHINAGKYTVGFNQAGTKVMLGEVDATANYDIDYATGTLTIAQADDIALTVNDVTVDYDGTSHTIRYDASSPTPNALTYEFKLGEGAWQDTIPSATVPGRYEITVKVYDANHVPVIRSATLVIEKRAVTFDIDEKTFEYDTTEHAVTTWAVSSGSLVNGHGAEITFSGNLRTAVGTNDVTATAIVVKDAAHADVTACYDIRWVKGAITVNPLGISLALTDFAGTYDSAPHTIGIVANGSYGEALTYRYSLDGEPWQDELPTFTDVGTHEIAVEVSCANYTTASGTARVTITKRPLTLTAGSYDGTYDGSAHSVSYAVEAFDPIHGTGLASGQAVDAALIGATRTSAGYGEVTFAMEAGKYTTRVLSGGTDVTANYDIAHENGHIALAVSGQGSIQAGGFNGVYDGKTHSPSASASYPTDETYEIWYSLNGTEWTRELPGFSDAGSHLVYLEIRSANYETLKAEVYINISLRALTITAGSAQKVYDGAELSKNAYEVANLAEGDLAYSVGVQGSRTDAGQGKNVARGAEIRTEQGRDVTENYDIGYMDGVLTVTRRPINVIAGGYTGAYDGQWHAVGYDAENLVAGDALRVTIEGASIKFPGSHPATFAKETLAITGAAGNVTGNYAPTFVPGTLTVTASEIAIGLTGNSGSYPYDAAAHAVSGFSLTGGALPNGTTEVRATAQGRGTSAGGV